MVAIKKVKRILHYFDLSIEFREDFEPDSDNRYREFIQLIDKLAKTKDELRYQQFGDKFIFIQDVNFRPNLGLVVGKLRSVRKDVFPEIIDMIDDKTRGIKAKEQEGIVETSHFLLKYTDKTVKLCLEFNQDGAKFTDFHYYLRNIGFHKGVLKEMGFRPIVTGGLKKIKDRVRRCSEFVVKVHRDFVDEMKEIDGSAYAAMEKAKEMNNPEYVTLDLKFEYRKGGAIEPDTSPMMIFINKLIKDPKKLVYFNSLKVKAEDEEKNFKLTWFDLLMDKLKSEVSVQLQPSHRVVISADIYDKMITAFQKKKL